MISYETVVAEVEMVDEDFDVVVAGVELVVGSSPAAVAVMMALGTSKVVKRAQVFTQVLEEVVVYVG